jgi:tyrosinase
VCVTKKPSRLNNGNSTLHDDFAFVHAKLFPQIHDFAGFLPWHRYFITVYEQALRDCGYTGTAMYWDWAADAANPTKASVWDPVTGFGGDGAATPDKDNRRCVTDGPFKNYRPVYYNFEVFPHCLSREWYKDDPLSNVIDMGNASYTPARVAEVTANAVFDDFRRDLENGPHGGVHRGVGFGYGDMGFQNASPNGESCRLWRPFVNY